MKVHPFLNDVERAEGYRLLCANPNGSVRSWSVLLGWSKSKVETFLSNLSKYRLADVVSLAQGSVFTPVAEGVSESVRSRPKVSEGVRSALGSKAVVVKQSTTKPRVSRGEIAARSDYARQLIMALNAACRVEWKEAYSPVSLDNFSSNDAAEWIEAQGVPVEKAVGHLQSAVRRFNPSKHGKTELPRSLAYFRKGIVTDWKREGQLALPLMVLESTARSDRKLGKPTHISDLIARSAEA